MKPVILPILPVLRWLVGLVFVAAALPKIATPAEFAMSLGGQPLLPDAALSPVAIVIPWVELVAAVALLSCPRFRAAASLLILTLLLAFTALLALSMIAGTPTSCGCFGRPGSILEAPGVALVRNLLLLAATGVVHLGELQRASKTYVCAGPRPEVLPSSDTASSSNV